MKAAVGAAVLIFLAACDTGTVSPSGTNWIITPDLSLHHDEPLLTGTGQCGNGVTTWIARSGEYDADRMYQGQTIVVSCYPGYAIGTWGLETRAK